MIYEYVNGYMDMYSGIEYMIVMRHVYIYIYVKYETCF